MKKRRCINGPGTFSKNEMQSQRMSNLFDRTSRLSYSQPKYKRHKLIEAINVNEGCLNEPNLCARFSPPLGLP